MVISNYNIKSFYLKYKQINKTIIIIRLDIKQALTSVKSILFGFHTNHLNIFDRNQKKFDLRSIAADGYSPHLKYISYYLHPQSHDQ